MNFFRDKISILVVKKTIMIPNSKGIEKYLFLIYSTLKKMFILFSYYYFEATWIQTATFFDNLSLLSLID